MREQRAGEDPGARPDPARDQVADQYDLDCKLQQFIDTYSTTFKGGDAVTAWRIWARALGWYDGRTLQVAESSLEDWAFQTLSLRCIRYIPVVQFVGSCAKAMLRDVMYGGRHAAGDDPGILNESAVQDEQAKYICTFELTHGNPCGCVTYNLLCVHDDLIYFASYWR